MYLNSIFPDATSHSLINQKFTVFPCHLQIRSVTLDVKVWDPTVLELFQILGNTYCNSVWEELLPLHRDLYVPLNSTATKVRLTET